MANPSQSAVQTPKIAICIAPGSEEMEVINTADILIRAGMQVTMASAAEDGSLSVKGSRGITLTADCPMVEIVDEPFDCVVLPGGLPGAEYLRDSTLVVEFVKQHKYDGKLVAAICAAPVVVLEHHMLYPEALMTAHPGFVEQIPENRRRAGRRVMHDVNNNLLTSQAPGTSQEFALEIITLLMGKSKTAEVAEPMVMWPSMCFDIIGGKA
ncbi:DJ-1 family glyoxalase III [Photobacterium galatheae]|uniref:Oxidative-stress-resistance chaperone n=1 Tax=Photobacterium galatheae TaxID=1654360 RepID=A0A066RZ39_9GAMM|nr:DJ-1 family glyoxalase III [Photobacterium galatheae]KDM92967.1 oxidative-stress-resistance chaperone [Photobacterium galatheae]MCM0148505.1 DJ-1/PfpI family protein [Photobacterium galatheae]